MNCLDCKFLMHESVKDKYGICRGSSVPVNRPASECPQKSFQRRISPWLIPDYDKLFNQLRHHVQSKINEKFDPGLFTLHDESHCINVEKMLKVLVTKSSIDFSALERFLLSCAAWTHDLGMSPVIADSFFKEMTFSNNTYNGSNKRRRDEHHNISCWYIQVNYKELFGATQANDETNDHLLSISWALSRIIQFHRKAEDITTCEEFTSIRGETVRLKLLAAILRLADTLHKDSTRFDHSTYAILKIASFGRISRLHWLKSFVVSNIHLSEFEQSITVHLKLPDYKHFHTFYEHCDSEKLEKASNDWAERVRNLEYVIATDIEADLVVVNGIFAHHKMPTYVKVNTDVAYIRGFSKDYFSDIDSVLSELDILFSPNTSKVITRTLDCLKAFSLGKYSDHENFIAQFRQLMTYLQDIYDERPCHASLGWLMEIVKSLIDSKCRDLKRIQEEIGCIVEKIKQIREKAKNDICNKVNEIIPATITNIFVVGFSSTVIKVLETLSSIQPNSKKNITVHVLECSTKRRLVHNNIMEYNDGAHYAIEIGKLGYFETHLIPDLGLATVLDKLKMTQNGINSTTFNPADNCLVMFGANGIDDKTGDCGHTSGHLMVAIAAKEFNVPVKVVSDSYKIWNIDWHSDAIRKGNWFATQNNIIEELSSAHVKVVNMREDKIPFSYITEIHTEYGCIVSGQSNDFVEQLKMMANHSKELYTGIIDEIHANLNH